MISAIYIRSARLAIRFSVVVLYRVRGPLVDAAWTAMIFAATSAAGVIQVLGAELFATSHRSTAAGLRLAVTTLGGAAGLALEGALYGVTGSHAIAISWLALAFAVPLPAIFLLKETAGREFEEIAPDGGGR